MYYDSRLLIDTTKMYILNSCQDKYILLDHNNINIATGCGEFFWLDVFGRTNSTYEIYSFRDIIMNKHNNKGVFCEYSNITTVDGKLVYFHNLNINGKLFKFSEFKFDNESLFYFFDEIHIKTFMYSKNC